jgi:hypothetical protein
MKLSDKAIKAITTQATNRLALEFKCSVYTVSRWVKDNESNGDLTKARAIQIIAEETGLPETEILENSDVEQEANK